jgi:hypothetical protein
LQFGFTVIDGIILAIALLGACLGIINTWKAIDRDRLKLKVIPKHTIPAGHFPDQSVTFCIEVTNLSIFAVTINEAGVLFHNTDFRGAVINPIIIDGEHYPRRWNREHLSRLILNLMIGKMIGAIRLSVLMQRPIVVNK